MWFTDNQYILRSHKRTILQSFILFCYFSKIRQVTLYILLILLSILQKNLRNELNPLITICQSQLTNKSKLSIFDFLQAKYNIFAALTSLHNSL